MRHRNFNLIALFLLVSGMTGLHAQTTGTFTDTRDGKVYKTVQIGKQVWLAENLAYKPPEGEYRAYKNLALMVDFFGYYYDWETANKVCPAGWHLPSDAEWAQLTDYLGGEDVAGGKLKETGVVTTPDLIIEDGIIKIAGNGYWLKPNNGATNESGFSALAAGYNWLGKSNNFDFVGKITVWWSATEKSKREAWERGVNWDGTNVGREGGSKRHGMSVRCLRD